ncbi:MAG: tRNA 4-thiouridine(8) synthase ThiI [Candidatus Nanoarchaeia archaeon]|nr:tRNA 4-thiouridine(8) synthase ThiI [Candidatus Nanoarchaeia archaeon]
MDCIVVHYSEIGTKGRNKSFFEKQLSENIKKTLGNKVKKVYKGYSYVLCELNKEYNETEITLILSKVPGVAYFSYCIRTKLDIEEIKRVSIEMLGKEKFSSFKVSCKRSDKRFEKNSKEINEILGEFICENLKKNVNLKNPDIELFVNVCNKDVFIYTKKIKGVGGLPVGSSARIICSLSGGIDSPVASFLMMKRGCEVVFVHIYNKTIQQGVLSKIDNLVKTLTKIQIKSKLYTVPFEDIQKELIKTVNSECRMIIYRRFMIKIINEIAKKEKIKAMVTGDSVGQVASQTIENLRCIYDASEIPVLAPLIGTNKEEVIDLAKKIGTYEDSIQPYPDCCSFMIAKSPETKARLETIKRIEDKIKNKEELIEKSILKSEIKEFC